MHKFLKSDGYTTKDLIHYGLDHIASSLKLFEFEPRTYDSAGYLAHIGIELYLKALMLNDLEHFINEHKFSKLYVKKNMPYSFFEISKENKKIFNILDQFSELRYPKPAQIIEIGSEDAVSIKNLSEEIAGKFPEKLKKEYESIDHTEKGGRVLMQKKKPDKWQKS